VGNVNDWAGTIGGTILGLELIIVLVIGVAINAGIAFGLYWVLKKMGWVHDKVAWALRLYEKYVEKAANVAAAPVIRGTSFWRGIRAGIHRATHWPQSTQPPAMLPAPVPATTSKHDTRAA
jgi:hypothetical protein